MRLNTVSSVFWAGIALEVVTFWRFCLVDSSSGSYRNQLYQSKIRLQILNLKFHQLKIRILLNIQITDSEEILEI